MESVFDMLEPNFEFGHFDNYQFQSQVAKLG